MKDVFIVNPKSGKNSQYELIKEIKEHFKEKESLSKKPKVLNMRHLSQKNMLYPMNLYIYLFVVEMELCMKLLMGVQKKKM